MGAGPWQSYSNVKHTKHPYSIFWPTCVVRISWIRPLFLATLVRAKVENYHRVMLFEGVVQTVSCFSLVFDWKSFWYICKRLRHIPLHRKFDIMSTKSEILGKNILYLKLEDIMVWYFVVLKMCSKWYIFERLFDFNAHWLLYTICYEFSVNYDNI